MEKLKKTYQVALMMGLAMIGSLFVYAACVELIKTNFRPFKGFSPFPGQEILRYLFLGMTVAEFALIKFIRRFILQGKEATPGISRSQDPSFSSSRVSKLLSAAIITYALCETVAIYGLVLFFMGGSSFDFYFFMVLSLIFFAVYFPRYNQWQDWMGESGVME